MTMLKISELTKKYGDFLANDKISLHIKKGLIYGFVGENGAGKTTLIRQITSLSSPTDGKIIWNNNDKINIGFAQDIPMLPNDMSAYSAITTYNHYLKLENVDVESTLQMVGLDNARKPIKKLSLGMKKRVSLAIALLGNPEIVILDEPFNGLDPMGIKDFRQLIMDINRNDKTTFIICSHAVNELIKMCDVIEVICKGKVIQEINLGELDDMSIEHKESHIISILERGKNSDFQ